MKHMGMVLTIVLLVGLVWGAFSPVSGLAQEPTPAVKTVEYLLLFDMPRPDELSVPLNMDRMEARQAAADWVAGQAQPVLAELERLRQEGAVSNFHFDARQLTVQVELPASGLEALSSLSAVGGVAQVMQSEKEMPCRPGYDQALAEVFFYASNPRQPDADRTAATNPSIFVHAPTGSIYTSIQGETNSLTEVTLTLKRAGAIYFIGSTISDGLGYYEFAPEYSSSCYYGSRFSWVIQPDDEVIVSAGGNTVKMTVSYLSAWIDPAVDQLKGYTDENKDVAGGVSTRSFSECGVMDSFYQTGVSQADGSISLDYSGMGDVLHNAMGWIQVYDANRNATWGNVQGFGLRVIPADRLVNVNFFPGTWVELELYRDEIQIETQDVFVNYEGAVYLQTDELILPGDEIFASSSGYLMEYTVAPLTLTPDPVTNAVTGETGPDLHVEISDGKAADNNFDGTWGTTCGYQGACIITQSDSLGAFSVNFPIDLERGDSLGTVLTDPTGHVQYEDPHVPVILANGSSSTVEGYWKAANIPVKIQIFDQLGAPLTELETTTDDRGYYTAVVALEPGYRIMVGDVVDPPVPTPPLVMDYPDLTAHANLSTEFFAGTASAGGNLMLKFSDYNTPVLGFSQNCLEVPALASSNYAFDLRPNGISPADYGYVYDRTPEGHIAIAYSHAFYVMLQVDADYLNGYAPLPDSDYTVELYNSSGSLIDTWTGTSSNRGYFYEWFPVGSLGTGARVKVSTGAYVGDITLPGLTLNKDVINQRIYGLSAPLLPGSTSLAMYKDCDGNCAYVLSMPFTADSAGNYSNSYKEVLGNEYFACEGFDMSSACSQVRMNYFTPEEHRVNLYAPRPKAAPADAYEDDDTAAQAKSFTSISKHSLHDEADVDWKKFTVAAADLGKPLVIETIKLGLMEDTVMWLFDGDGTTQIEYNDDGGLGLASRIVFTPSHEGTYFVKVAPYDIYDNTGNCGSTYSIILYKGQVFLPQVSR